MKKAIETLGGKFRSWHTLLYSDHPRVLVGMHPDWMLHCGADGLVYRCAVGDNLKRALTTFEDKVLQNNCNINVSEKETITQWKTELKARLSGVVEHT